MHIEYLYYFKDFSRTLSISKTAAHYFMTPQGLSRALHQLEKDFGVTLMTYQNNLISLTPAGEELSRRIDAIVELYDEAKGSLTEYKLADMAPSKGLVRITVTSCVSQYLISLLNLQRPGQFPFEVKLNESNLYRIVPHILSRDQEESFGIISLPMTEKYRSYVDELVEDGGMVYEPLFTSPLVAMVSSFSPLARRDAVRPRDVDPYPVARYKDTVLGDALDDYILEDNVKTVTNAGAIIFVQIMEHQAVGFAPKLVEGLRTLPDRVVTKPTEGFFSTEFGLLSTPENRSREHVDAVIRYIRKTVAEKNLQPRYLVPKARNAGSPWRLSRRAREEPLPLPQPAGRPLLSGKGRAPALRIDFAGNPARDLVYRGHSVLCSGTSTLPIRLTVATIH